MTRRDEITGMNGDFRERCVRCDKPIPGHLVHWVYFGDSKGPHCAKCGTEQRKPEEAKASRERRVCKACDGYGNKAPNENSIFRQFCTDCNGTGKRCT